MEVYGWRLIEAAASAGDRDVVDCSEFAYPEAGAPAAAGAAVLLPPESRAWWGEAARSAGLVVLDRVETAEQLTDLARRLESVAAPVVVRLRTGRGLHYAEEIAAALRGALRERARGLWYGLADLVVDFSDEPAGLYFYDAAEGRSGSPEWLRSRCLTVARAYDLELWGQADLTFAEPPADDELDRCLRLAALSGFDVLVGSGAVRARVS